MRGDAVALMPVDPRAAPAIGVVVAGRHVHHPTESAMRISPQATAGLMELGIELTAALDR
jgi:hypothetical protein